MKTSERGRNRIADHEGVVLRAYLDSANVWTIGVGHTAKAGGLKPKRGMTITRQKAMQEFARDLNKFEKRVSAVGCFNSQAPFDGAVSFDFNTGAINKATWVKRYSKGLYDQAEKSLMLWVKAGGRKIAGLVNRRKAEADLIFRGDYGDGGKPEGIKRSATPKPEKTPDPVVKEAQEILTAKGFNPGAIDGWMGHKTKDALLAYQRAHPDLTNDGILGPATLAQLRRDAAAVSGVVKDMAGKKGVSTLFGAIGAFFAGIPWWAVAGIVVVGVVVYGAWRYRDVIQRRFNTITGRVVA